MPPSLQKESDTGSLYTVFLDHTDPGLLSLVDFGAGFRACTSCAGAARRLGGVGKHPLQVWLPFPRSFSGLWSIEQRAGVHSDFLAGYTDPGFFP